MRISDWSSDVCSSDLDRLRCHRQIDIRFVDATDHGRQHVDLDLFAGNLAQRFGDRFGTALHVRLDHDVERLLFALPHARRSEEHTSELQSLMRISYVAFCLMKKRKYLYLYTKITRPISTNTYPAHIPTTS